MKSKKLSEKEKKRFVEKMSSAGPGTIMTTEEYSIYKRKKLVETYLHKTGQSLSELLQGASTFGVAFIENELVPKALRENKKIVWKNDPKDSQVVGLVKFELKDI